jgi:hypothetical protein
MRFVRRSLVICLVALLMAPAARAQSHVIGKMDLEKAVQQRVSQEQSDRDAIVSLLRRAEVRDVAVKAGLSLETAEAAVATLQGEELRELASQARQAHNDLAGGASTVVISTTTIIIVLLIIVLLVLIAD